MSVQRNQKLCFVSTNVNGLKRDYKFEEICLSLQKNKTFAATLQETWHEGQEELNLRGHTFLLNGPPAQTSNRGSAGVGIVLSPSAVNAWSAASCKLHSDLGPSFIADRLLFPTPATAPWGIF